MVPCLVPQLTAWMSSRQWCWCYQVPSLHPHLAEQGPVHPAPQGCLSPCHTCCWLPLCGDLFLLVSVPAILTTCLCCSGFPRPWFDSPHPELRLGHWCCPPTSLFRGCTHFKISPKFWVFLALLGIFFLITFTKWKPWFRLTANPNSPQPCRVWMQAPHRKQATHLTLTSPDSQELVGKIIILIFIEVKHHILHRNAKILIVLVDFYKSEAAVTNPHHNKPHKQEGLPQHGCLPCPYWELRMHALVERWRSCRWWCQSTQPRPPEAPRC